MPVYIPAIDWEVLAILIGASLFVDVSSESGLFSWMAIKLTKLSQGDPVRLLNYYGWLTVIFSAVLNNVTAMIIIGSLTAVSLERLKKRDMLLGFLLIEGLLTNIGGLLTLISSVPNIIVGNIAGIPFLQFFLVAAPFVLFTTFVTIQIGMRMFSITALTEEEEIAAATEMVAGFDENDQVQSESFFRLSACALVAFILCLASASVLPVVKDLGMGFVALAFAAGMLVLYKHEVGRFYSKLDWDLMAFFACLFVVIYTMEHAQVLNAMGEGIKGIIAMGEELGAAGLLLSSACASAVTDNVPLAAVLAKILKGLGTAGDSKLWWAVIFGANLGGNLTPIGSASTVVAVTVMTKNKISMPFMTFVRNAAPFAVVQILIAMLYVWLFL
jgi:Na+/H+ antiporter NhaD/arsenite permease-like protein